MLHPNHRKAPGLPMFFFFLITKMPPHRRQNARTCDISSH